MVIQAEPVMLFDTKNIVNISASEIQAYFDGFLFQFPRWHGAILATPFSQPTAPNNQLHYMMLMKY